MAHLNEALALQPHLSADAILFILDGLQAGAEAACADATGVVPVLNSMEQVARRRQQGLGLMRRRARATADCGPRVDEHLVLDVSALPEGALRLGAAQLSMKS